MAGYPEKWQLGSPEGRTTPRPLVLEAGLELITLGSAIAAFAAMGVLPLSWSGLSVAALCYAGVTLLVAIGLNRHAPHHHFGLANAITLCRAALNIVLLAVIAEEMLGNEWLNDQSFRWGLTIAAAIAWVLDGLDGWAARRSNMASEFGARFDMETDGVFLLSLSLLLIVGGIVGPWVVASGMVYYVFRLASRIWPVLNTPLTPSLRRKTICAAQGALLIAALAPVMPSWGAQLSCLTGLTLLLYSFGVDLVWLLGRQR